MSGDEREREPRETDKLLPHADEEAPITHAKRNMPGFTLYKRRWFVLFVVAGLNFTNGALWISFAPISNHAAEFFNVTCDVINWLSVVFFITMIPFGIIATICTDTKGLKPVILIGSTLNFLGALIRLLACLSFVPKEYQFAITMTGQTIIAIGQPFFLLIPTRVSEVWFPDSQRTISTTILSMGNPLGAAVSSVISPFVLDNNCDRIGIINYIWTPAALILVLAAYCGITTSAPPTPPTASANTAQSHSYIVGIKQLFANKDYVVLFVGVGGGIGIISCLQIMIQQFLCPKGYSDDFAGLCGGLMICCGMISTMIASIVADKTKRLEEIAKICFAFAAISASVLAVVFRFSDSQYLIAVICGLFGAFAFASYPVSLELAAETTYPVNEGMSAGFILLSGQVQAIVYILLMRLVKGPLSSHDRLIQTCEKNSESQSQMLFDMTVPGYIFSAVIFFCICLLIIFYKADYKRMKVEQLRITNSILANDPDETLSNSVSIYD